MNQGKGLVLYAIVQAWKVTRAIAILLPFLLKGSTFTAKLQVIVKAQQPSPGGPIPDPTSQYLGSGSFTTKNEKVKGT